MAVYTPLDAGVVSRLLGSFGAGPLRSFTPIPEGIENTNYRVAAAGGEFVLTVYERSSAEQVEAVVQATGTLAERGVPCPRTSRTGSGGQLEQYQGRPVTLVELAPGSISLDPDVKQLETLGRALAELHRCGADLSLPGDAHAPEVLLPAGFGVADRLSGEWPDMSVLVSEECQWQESHLPDPVLPGGLIHADLFRDNVLFADDGGGVTGLLDFHLAGRGPWMFDLAVVLLDWCWAERGVDGDQARAVLRGYRAVRPPVGAEYKHLSVLLRRAALRYLCLRCERFLLPDREQVHGVRKDPWEFAAKLEVLQRLAGEAPR